MFMHKLWSGVVEGAALVVRMRLAAGACSGVADLQRPDPGKGQAGSYALLVADTYLVAPEAGSPAECLTQAVSRAWSEIAYYFKVGCFGWSLGVAA